MRLISIIIIILALSDTWAQKIYYCRSYTDSGEPIEIIQPQNLKVGDNLCILVQTSDLYKSDDIAFLFIDQVLPGERQNQFNRVFKLTNGKKWFAVFYKFTKDGNFEITVTDSKKKSILKSNLTIAPVQVEPEEPVQDEYYKNSQAYFCKKIIDNKPYEILDFLSLKSKEDTFLYIENDKPLGTDLIVLNIIKKGAEGKFDEIASIKKYQSSNEWLNTFIKVKLTKIGSYKIYIFNHNELLMKTIYISVIE